MDRFYDGKIHNPLSNFYEYDFVSHGEWMNGFVWPSSEHYYQAAKARERVQALEIAKAPTPGASKRLGRNCRLRLNWDEIKIPVMRRALLFKFAVSDLSDPNSPSSFLLGTGDDRLIEGNTWNDTFWGTCKGEGYNWLGHLLMARRAELRYAVQQNPQVALDV